MRTAMPVDPALITGSAVSLLGVTVDAGDIRCWGAIPGPANQARWNRMAPGDAALVYTGRNLIPKWGRVLDNAHDPSTASSIWGTNSSGDTWEYMYFLELSDFSTPVSLARIRTDLGYDANWVPQGFQYPRTSTLDRVLSSYGSVDAWLLALESASTAGTPTLGPPPTRPFTPAGAAIIRRSSTATAADPDVYGRGVNAHRALLRKLARNVRAAGFAPREPRVPTPNWDLAWDTPSLTWIVEAKSLTPSNETHQLRLGLGQLLEFLSGMRAINPGATYKSALVVEYEPIRSGFWSRVCADVDVVLAWPGEFGRIGL
jgi:hypothetical protein